MLLLPGMKKTCQSVVLVNSVTQPANPAHSGRGWDWQATQLRRGSGLAPRRSTKTVPPKLVNEVQHMKSARAGSKLPLSAPACPHPPWTSHSRRAEIAARWRHTTGTDDAATMHTVLNRANALVFTGLAALAMMAAATIITTLGHVPQPKLTRLHVSALNALEHATGRDPYTRKSLHVDRARVTLDLDAGECRRGACWHAAPANIALLPAISDLTSAFNWNVRQLFAFVVAEVRTEAGSVHQVTLWDTIIRDKSEAHLVLNEAQTEYEWMDDARDLRGAQVTLALFYDAMPWVGPLHLSSSHSGSLRLPEKYCNRGKCTLQQSAELADGTVAAEDMLPVRRVDGAAGALPTVQRSWF